MGFKRGVMGKKWRVTHPAVKNIVGHRVGRGMPFGDLKVGGGLKKRVEKP